MAADHRAPEAERAAFETIVAELCRDRRFATGVRRVIWVMRIVEPIVRLFARIADSRYGRAMAVVPGAESGQVLF